MTNQSIGVDRCGLPFKLGGTRGKLSNVQNDLRRLRDLAAAAAEDVIRTGESEMPQFPTTTVVSTLRHFYTTYRSGPHKCPPDHRVCAHQ